MVQYTFSRIIYWGCVFCCRGVRRSYHISYMVIPSRITLIFHDHHHYNHYNYHHDHRDHNQYTHQRMRKTKASPRQIIPMNFSSLQQRLKKHSYCCEHFHQIFTKIVSNGGWTTVLLLWIFSIDFHQNVSNRGWTTLLLWEEEKFDCELFLQKQMLPGEIQMQKGWYVTNTKYV